MTAKRVPQPLLLYQINRAFDDCGQFVAHGCEVPETPGGIVGKGNQHVDVAFGAEVVSENASPWIETSVARGGAAAALGTAGATPKRTNGRYSVKDLIRITQ
jgi:hypothetical protein